MTAAVRIEIVWHNKPVFLPVSRSLRACEEIVSHSSADVLVGRYSRQEPQRLSARTSALRISSTVIDHLAAAVHPVVELV